jgi:hypothetical protein
MSEQVVEGKKGEKGKKGKEVMRSFHIGLGNGGRLVLSERSLTILLLRKEYLSS